MKNYAFISYSHDDIKSVRKLHKQIEKFRIPRYIRRAIKNAPRKLYPIFRDETDLSSVLLTPEIQRALSESDFLIVICSENSVRSEWVELEIEEFVKHHDVKAIIPVVLDVDKRDSFSWPQGLMKRGKDTEKNFLFSRKNKKICIFEIVTTILGCWSYELTERYRRRQSFFRKGMICFGVCCVIYLQYRFSWWYYRVYDDITYYKDIKYHYNYPIGLNELKFWELDEVDDYYIFTSRGVVVRTEHVRNNDELPIIPGGFLLETECMEYSYNQNWGEDGYAQSRVSQITYKNAEGKILFVKNISLGRNIVDLTISEEDCNPFYLPVDMTIGQLTQEFSEEIEEISGCRIIQMYDSAGRVGLVVFVSGTDNNMICDKNGYYGMEYVYDEDGQISKVRFLDQDSGTLDLENALAEYDITY